MTDRGDLTVVLPLKDRVEFTWRWLAYADRTEFPFRVLIADGGANPSVETFLADRTRFPNVDYEYVRYPYDASYREYYAKLADAVSRVKTPYAALADNDDFFIIDGLRNAVSFLQGHPDYVACGGQCVPFWIAGDETRPSRAPLYGSRIEWKFSDNAHSVDSERAADRVRSQSLGANDIFYHVTRTDQMRRQFAMVRELDPHDLFLVEHLITYLCSIAGKIRQLDSLFIARQQNSPGSSGGAHQQKYGGWFGRMLVPTWSRDFNGFVDMVAAALASADGIEPEAARAWVVKSYQLAVAPSLLSDVLEEETVTPAMPVVAQAVRRLVALPESNWLKRAARAVYRRSRWVSFEAVYATQFMTTPATDANRDFKAVRDFLAGTQPSNRTSGT